MTEILTYPKQFVFSSLLGGGGEGGNDKTVLPSPGPVLPTWGRGIDWTNSANTQQKIRPGLLLPRNIPCLQRMCSSQDLNEKSTCICPKTQSNHRVNDTLINFLGTRFPVHSKPFLYTAYCKRISTNDGQQTLADSRN